ncbi:hypothetical protein L483_11380 [Pseudomonas putida H8234]|nr:hypothetical protein L483_11380 [Pseudomonas putida H8234]
MIRWLNARVGVALKTLQVVLLGPGGGFLQFA